MRRGADGANRCKCADVWAACECECVRVCVRAHRLAAPAQCSAALQRKRQRRSSSGLVGRPRCPSTCNAQHVTLSAVQTWCGRASCTTCSWGARVRAPVRAPVRACVYACAHGPRNDTFMLSAAAHQNRNLGLRFSSLGRGGRASPCNTSKEPNLTPNPN